MSTKALTIFLLGLLALSFGCNKKEPIVTIDDWWNVDYAKNGCELRAANGNPCVGDPVVELRDFEAQMSTFFASDSACQGVVLTNFDGPTSAPSKAASEADSKADWQLMLDFNMGESSQGWTMMHRADSHHSTPYSYRTGQGNPKEIVHTVCAVVKQSGGSIVN